MKHISLVWAAYLVFGPFACGLLKAADEIDSPAVRAQVARSLALIQASEQTWRSKRRWISCHHQFLGAVTMTVAQERSFPPLDRLMVRVGELGGQIPECFLVLSE